MSAVVYAICDSTNCFVEAHSTLCPACGRLVPEWAVQGVRLAGRG